MKSILYESMILVIREKEYLFFQEHDYTEYFLENYFKSRLGNLFFSFPSKLS